jgi:hypothetical protein
VSQRSPERNELIVSYMLLRQVVGWIGTLLPIVLIVGNAISSTTPRPGSMSGYYYTDMRNVFVGALCALVVSADEPPAGSPRFPRTSTT